MTYKAAIQKLQLERIGMAPFVWLGKLAAVFFPLKTKHGIFLFFPNADIGGSPRVNAELTHLLKDKAPIIIFSKKAGVTIVLIASFGFCVERTGTIFKRY